MAKKDPTLAALGIADGWPLVIPVTDEAAMVAKCSLAELHRVTARLKPWGRDAAGRDVFRFRDVLTALGTPLVPSGRKAPVDLVNSGDDSRIPGAYRER